MASPRANKSEAWKHFEKVDDNKVRCKLCKDELKYSGGSTSGMMNHLRSQHAASASVGAAASDKSGKTTLASFGFSPTARQSGDIAISEQEHG